MDAGSLISLLDQLLPGRHALTVVMVVVLFVTCGALAWFSRLLAVWRKDRRDERESITVLMGHLVEAQHDELTRRSAEGDALRRQVDTFVEGRWALQHALDDLRDQLIAARVAIHDYERRLGLPETAFPPLPLLPTLKAP